jgi:hypothetical protein
MVPERVFRALVLFLSHRPYQKNIPFYFSILQIQGTDKCLFKRQAEQAKQELMIF